MIFFYSKTRRISRTEPELIDFVSFKMSKIARGTDSDGNFRTMSVPHADNRNAIMQSQSNF